MAMTANLNRDEKKRVEPFTAADFMNFHDNTEEELTEQELEDYAREVFGA